MLCNVQSWACATIVALSYDFYSMKMVLKLHFDFEKGKYFVSLKPYYVWRVVAGSDVEKWVASPALWLNPLYLLSTFYIWSPDKRPPSQAVLSGSQKTSLKTFIKCQKQISKKMCKRVLGFEKKTITNQIKEYLSNWRDCKRKYKSKKFLILINPLIAKKVKYSISK